jgi:hypothetical protein
VYNQMHPDAKTETHQSISQIANQYSRLRDIAKETKQKRAMSLDPIADELQNTTKKAIASNYLKKYQGQGGGQVEGRSSPVLNKEKKLVEDLNRIKEINSIMKMGGSVTQTDSIISEKAQRPLSANVISQMHKDLQNKYGYQRLEQDKPYTIPPQQ